MINALLIEKDVENSIELTNTIHMKIKNLRISAISNKLTNIRHILNKHDIDIILMNIDSFPNTKIVKKHTFLNNKYKNSVILISNNKSIKNNSISKSYIYNYIINPDNISNLIEPINELVKIKMNNAVYDIKDSKENIIKKKIKKELSNLRYKFSHKGTQYIIETIYFLYKTSDYYNNNYERDIYPIIAQKLETSAHNIKCDIRNATEKMKSTWEENELLKYLNNPSDSNLGPKRIIEFVLTKI